MNAYVDWFKISGHYISSKANFENTFGSCRTTKIFSHPVLFNGSLLQKQQFWFPTFIWKYLIYQLLLRLICNFQTNQPISSALANCLGSGKATFNTFCTSSLPVLSPSSVSTTKVSLPTVLGALFSPGQQQCHQDVFYILSRFWKDEVPFLKFILQLGRQKQLLKLQLKLKGRQIG